MRATVFSRDRPANCQDFVRHQPLRILLAEGHRELRRLLGFILRSDGHDVTDAGDGGELLEAIASRIIDGDETQFDLILSEQDLPGLPGISVLAGLRSRGRHTPFILLTENAGVQDRARGLDAVILASPLSVESIRRAVRQAQNATPSNRLAAG